MSFSEVLCLCVVIIRVCQIQFTGLGEKNLTDYENVYEAYLRLKKNNQFNDLFKTDYESIHVYLTLLNNLKFKIKRIFTNDKKTAVEKNPEKAAEKYRELIEEEKRITYSRDKFNTLVQSIEGHMLKTLAEFPRERNEGL